MWAFWLFLAVYIVCEAWLFSKGYDTAFFSHKTAHEKKIRRDLLGLSKEEDDQLYEQGKKKKKKESFTTDPGPP